MRKIFKWVGVGYISQAVLFFNFPYLIKDTKHQLASNNILRVSHRGGSFLHLENTIDGFLSASDDCDIIEIDVQICSDYNRVVFHDFNLSRIYGKNLLTKDAILSDFSSPKETIPIEYWLNTELKIDSRKEDIKSPTLREALDALPKKQFLLDLKGDYNDRALDLLVEDISSSNSEKRILLAHSSEKVLDYLKLRLPESRIVSHPRDLRKLVFGIFTGILPHLDFESDVFSLIYMDQKMEEWMKVDPFEKHFPFKIELNRIWRYIFPIVSKHLIKRGFHVFPWVVNDKRALEFFIREESCTGIITDDLEKLNSILSGS